MSLCSVFLFTHQSIYPGSLSEACKLRGSVQSILTEVTFFSNIFLFLPIVILFGIATSIITMLDMDVHNHSTSLDSMGPTVCLVISLRGG